MARCTAPKEGHRSSSAAAACPACRGRFGGYRSSSYSSYSPSYTPYFSSESTNPEYSGRGGSSGSSRPRWSRSGSPVVYTAAQVRALTPVRENIETLAKKQPDLRDAFLCHAWDDRHGAAKELHDLLVARNVSVWFSEKDIGLGVPLMRAIDRGLANSKVGIVLVTPALLNRLRGEGIADRELSVLLRGERLVPILHGTTFEALNEVSPMLASRTGLSSKDETMSDIVIKLADLILI